MLKGELLSVRTIVFPLCREYKKKRKEGGKKRKEKRKKKTVAVLSISWDASLEGKKALDESGSSLSSRNAAEVPETEAETSPRADGNRDKALLPPEGASNSSLWSALNVSE